MFRLVHMDIFLVTIYLRYGADYDTDSQDMLCDQIERKLHDCAVWRSPSDDYRWIWWDPGQRMQNRFCEERRNLRWLPTWFKSYSYIAADTIWNPGPPPRHSNTTTSDFCSGYSSLRAMTGALSTSGTPGTLTSRTIYYALGGSNVTSSSSQLFFQRGCQRAPTGVLAKPSRQYRSECIRNCKFERGHLKDASNIHLHQTQSHCFFSPSVMRSGFAGRGPGDIRSLSLPCLLSQRYESTVVSNVPHSTKSSFPEGRQRTTKKFQDFRKHQVWSARMALQPSRYRELLGPPAGTPRSGLSVTSSSDQTSLLILNQSRRMEAFSTNSSTLIPNNPNNHNHVRNVEVAVSVDHVAGLAVRYSAVPACGRSSLPCRLEARHRTGLGLEEERDSDGRTRQKEPLRMHRSRPRQSRERKKRKLAGLLERKVPISELTSWELQFIDGLDRRLEWLYNQLCPGRRPYHFALLANHWLNKETWLVIDPPTRISISARRRLGDPRFNSPYPKPDWTAKPKYPRVPRKTVYTPKINSWRLAVNKHRKASGLRDMVKTIKFYPDSTADPPDGKVDPSCWMLRRPPQGSFMSARQGKVYYEGGAGWQETFDDWQKIRHGYLIQKAIHEGGVNRTRARETAGAISRYFHMATAKGS
ncbi:hypothetical protein BO83DRAFT_446185 [Aspergillus eucalypticola CBS 122712]|uniref:Uncharacterized protein n=1 Tax=Aspergillus eucalypticola (strain CBS 122712 / IBT 29274) TaxID=1448314 RepID=A0A317VFS8_ASPEC|nr:uncharacterized protein BO83DRAFT_446185 [Aspergillus eucalypticola CBS 122712]PWY71848.1 hypothetical protein BO83DRAFT_446185 [Aspergillus eucalypticola CBS 122712]